MAVYNRADVGEYSLQANIGVVPQDPFLFKDSIMSNIRCVKRTASDAEVRSACKLAAIHEKIMSFPEAYNTKVGSNGFTLPGGEKQRLAIARVILKRSKIILLDEPTSAVDSATEQSILEAFKAVRHECMTLVIAHRLSTIRDANNIIVMKDGAIIEVGTHNNLLLAEGPYYDFGTIQLQMQAEDMLSLQHI